MREGREGHAFRRSNIHVSRNAKKYFCATPELFSWLRADLTLNVPGRESVRFLTRRVYPATRKSGRVDLNRPVARWRTPIEPPIEGERSITRCTHSFFHSREMDVEARCGRQPKCASIPSAEMIEFRRN